MVVSVILSVCGQHFSYFKKVFKLVINKFCSLLIFFLIFIENCVLNQFFVWTVQSNGFEYGGFFFLSIEIQLEMLLS